MIDPHVHLRDGNQKDKETVLHGLSVAYKACINALFEMPNTDPALVSYDAIKKRIKLQDAALSKINAKMFCGLYAGVTADINQIKEVINCYNTFFPRVVGLKMYAGHSTGNMGIVNTESQKLVYETLARLNYKGVLTVHCEKESENNPKIWNPKEPYTHTLARPPNSEVESVKDQIDLATNANFSGTLHICHISVPEALSEIEKARKNVDFKITCGITMHHALLYSEQMKQKDGFLLKMNPPLRPKKMQDQMFKALLDGRIDWIESDHAPHTLKDKQTSNPSGIPALPFYPHFIRVLQNNGLSDKRIKELTYDNIINAFGISSDIIPYSNDLCDYNLSKEYEYDAFSGSINNI